MEKVSVLGRQKVNVCTQEELTNLPLEKIHALWRSNNAALLNVLKKKHVPYFGLHGTSQEKHNQILAQKICYLEIATFHNRPDPELFLADLYAMSSYPVFYAFEKHKEETPGGIMIINTQKDGENMADRWESLKGTRGGWRLGLCLDNNKEAVLVKNVGDHNIRSNSYPSRSEIDLYPDTFDAHYCGTYDYESARKYLEEVPDDASKMARIILSTRLMSQDILVNSLQHLKVI